jgi:hypothetical protein
VADRAQRYKVWKKEKEETPEPELLMEDQDEDETAAGEAEEEKQTAAENETGDGTEQEAGEEPAPDKADQEEQEPKAAAPAEGVLCAGLKAVQVDVNEVGTEANAERNGAEEESVVEDDEGNEEEDDGEEATGEEEAATQPHGPEMPRWCSQSAECAGAERCNHGGNWEEVPGATPTANFESLADWFRNAGAFRDSFGQPTGKEIPVLTLLKLPINTEKQYTKEDQNEQGGN